MRPSRIQRATPACIDQIKWGATFIAVDVLPFIVNQPLDPVAVPQAWQLGMRRHQPRAKVRSGMTMQFNVTLSRRGNTRSWGVKNGANKLYGTKPAHKIQHGSEAQTAQP